MALQAAENFVAAAAEKNLPLDPMPAAAVVAEIAAVVGPVVDHCYLDTYVLFL